MSLPSGLNFSIPETADSQTRVFEKQIRPDSGTQFRQTELMRFTIPKHGCFRDVQGIANNREWNALFANLCSNRSIKSIQPV